MEELKSNKVRQKRGPGPRKEVPVDEDLQAAIKAKEQAKNDPDESLGLLEAQRGSEDLEAPKKRASRLKVEATEGVEEVAVVLPRNIHLRAPSEVLKATVPGSVFRCAPFKYEPRTFVVESERLNSKIMSHELQTRSLKDWLRDPISPLVYSVAGNPDDSKAAYFAAYLVSIHMRKLGARANPVWEVLYGGYHDPKVLARSENLGRPTLLVVSNLASNSIGSKIGKAQDLIEQFSSIPIIIVSAGEDPLSFMSARMHKPVQAIAYFSESLVKKTIEVI